MKPVAPELWGGIECTCNRIADRWCSQLERNGHRQREGDLARIAGLGVRRLRYALLWEECVSEVGDTPDFSWADRRLAELRDLGMLPIAGLLHHGSGPRGTSLVDPKFPAEFARYAGTVARRYPWICDWTPINEPLTTARFSGLYGHWYPHARDPGSFARALVNQCRATVLAMAAIRALNPRARLVQTDDLGRTYASASLQYQAEFENERRWLGWDLLCGRVDGGHPLRAWLAGALGGEEQLEWLLDHPCPPEVIGINHYVTSNRYLDADWARHPPHVHGGNGRGRYADVEAIRMLPGTPDSWQELIAAAAARYRRPVALTEVHIGAGPEEQVSWFDEAWGAARRACESGIEVEGVTSWALLGSFDWNSLLTRDSGHYEPGAFDVRDGTLRPTLLAEHLRALWSNARLHASPAARAGWWRRSERLLFPLETARRHRTRDDPSAREAAQSAR